MEMEVGLAPLVVQKDFVSCYWVCTSNKLYQKGLKKLTSNFKQFLVKKVEF